MNGQQSSQTVNKGEEVALPSTTSCTAPAGKVFAGWLTSPDATTLTKRYVCNIDKTFYAKWGNPVEYYKIVLNDNCHVSGGQPTVPSDIYYAISAGDNNLTPGKWYMNLPLLGFTEITRVSGLPTCGTSTYNGHKINDSTLIINQDGSINTGFVPVASATAMAQWEESGSRWAPANFGEGTTE